jgi:hypothetical protein
MIQQFVLSEESAVLAMGLVLADSSVVDSVEQWSV